MTRPAVNVLDIGGRYGLHRSWRHFEMPINYYCFEADDEEAARLSGVSQVDGQDVRVINAAVSDSIGAADVYLYEERDLSSLFPINPGVSYRYGHAKLERVVSVATTTLDAVTSEHGITADFLSIDAQGATLRVLDGAKSALKRNLAMRCEMEFFPLYRDAPLAHQVMARLNQLGYGLARMEMCGPGLYGISTEMNAFSVSSWDARPSSCDAIFVNHVVVDALLATPVSSESAAKLLYLAAFCIHNGCGNFGAEILDRLHKRGALADILATQSPALNRQMKGLFGYYLSLARSNVNRGFDGTKVFRSLFGEDIAAQSQLAADARAKLDKIYSQPFNP